MGFSDFLSKAGKAIGKVVHSPIVEGISAVAGAVSDAIPVVGPIVNAGIPLAKAIFSKDKSDDGSTDQSSVVKVDLPILDDLNRKMEDIEKDLVKVMDTIKDAEKKFEAQVNMVAAQLTAEIRNAPREQKMRDWSNTTNTAIEFLLHQLKDDHDGILNLTPNSPAPKFDIIFAESISEDTLMVQRNRLKEAFNVARQEMKANLSSGQINQTSQRLLDLILLMTTWILVFDKALLIARGTQAQACFTQGAYTKYVNTLTELHSDIQNLREESKLAISLLKQIIADVPGMRMAAITAAFETATKDTDPNQHNSYMKDSIDASGLPIGSVPPSDIYALMNTQQPPQEVGLKSMLWYNPTIQDMNQVMREVPNFYQYRDLVSRTMDFYLGPAMAMQQMLEDSLRQWLSRIPLIPASIDDSQKPIIHVTGTAYTKESLKASKPPLKRDRAKKPLSRYYHKEVRYCITYVNEFGESLPTSQTEKGFILTEKTGTVAILLNISKVTSVNDPFKGIENSLKYGSLASRSIVLRRIWITFIENDNLKDTVQIFDWIGDIDESTDSFLHGEEVDDSYDPELGVSSGKHSLAE